MAAFEDLSAQELATAIRRREISAREALDARYARIDAKESSRRLQPNASASGAREWLSPHAR
ncbi:hypothetical protein [Blastococcus mobilis]|uniref:Uncharacterized protein n=1 Tax=Blastococcus mobilis TaxID=1938746 RepID=A0A239AFH9_9ACTN|nr:hypothetical protein [Blastococcus mobilis]SNR94102.1 hypothetical protein SAMN06272737_14314 [Blastococcus mobilis]